MRMRRYLAALGLAVVASAGSLTFAASGQAAAAPLCSDEVVSDPADVLDDAAVERAAARFDDEVVVKVLTFETTGGRDLYDLLVDAREQCQGWGFDANGSESLLILGVATRDRTLGSHYDGVALETFDAARDHAEVDGMGANFGNGDWTDGMVDGLTIYARAYDGTPASGTPSTAPNGSDPLGGAEEASGSGSGANWVLGGLAGLCVAGGAAYGGTKLWRWRAATKHARATLSGATDEMATAWMELDGNRHPASLTNKIFFHQWEPAGGNRDKI